MATRYPVDILLHLRQSPLCVKPSTLPPPEEWMGPPPETFRNSQGTGGVKAGTERTRNDTSMLDGTNKRPGADRHTSRNSSNPDDIVLGPPRTTFNSATLLRPGKPFDTDKTDRFAQLRRNGEGDASERNNKDRDGRKDFRRRGDADQDSDGWSTVKPRKSFGHEGAERFHGRMGERPEKLKSDQRLREGHGDDSDDRKPRRNNFGEFSRDKDGDDGEKPRRNGQARNKTDQPPWSRSNTADAEPPSGRERFDRGKSWRDRDDGDKPKDRNYDRRWDREHRQEREPEWLDEPAEESAQGHTEADLKKFMESMKASKAGAAKADAPTTTLSNLDTTRGNAFEAEKSKPKSAPAVEMGPDKFFANFASPTSNADKANPLEAVRDSGAPAKPKTGSRFQNFFSAQDRQDRQTEPTTPGAGPSSSDPVLINPLLAFASAAASSNSQPHHTGSSDVEEKAAFESLIQKLHKQKPFTSTPPSGGFPTPQQTYDAKGSVSSPGSFQESLGRGLSQQQPQEIHAPRPQQVLQLPPQLPPMRPDQQMLHELIGQRHPGLSNQGGRDQIPSRNSKEEFLMTLMQSARNPPEVTRPEQYIRMPQPSRPAQIPSTPDREEYPRERNSAQHQGRPQGLPAFFDEAQLLHEHEQRRHQQQQQQQHQQQQQPPPQPTQILQRQVPPGLDQVHPGWIQGNQHLAHGPGGLGGRPMIPPPGLAGSRNGPMPGGNFPPNFPPGIGGAFPPEGFRGPPAPPGFYGGPPPGLFPPGFQGAPEQIPYGGFDGRGMPPGGAFRR